MAWAEGPRMRETLHSSQLYQIRRPEILRTLKYSLRVPSFDPPYCKYVRTVWYKLRQTVEPSIHKAAISASKTHFQNIRPNLGERAESRPFNHMPIGALYLLRCRRFSEEWKAILETLPPSFAPAVDALVREGENLFLQHWFIDHIDRSDDIYYCPSTPFLTPKCLRLRCLVFPFRKKKNKRKQWKCWRQPRRPTRSRCSSVSSSVPPQPVTWPLLPPLPTPTPTPITIQTQLPSLPPLTPNNGV